MSCRAASTSVADIVRIAETIARATTTAGVLYQDDAPQQFTDIAKGRVLPRAMPKALIFLWHINAR